MANIKFTINFDNSIALRGFNKLNDSNFKKTISLALEFISKVLLRDCRKYIPILTGKLRDSGHIEELKNLSKILVWDAANDTNNYIYAKKQYKEVLQHINGVYAAEWLEKAVNENPYKYTRLLNLFIEREYRKLFKQEK